MKNLKNQLIKLGSTNPSLRPHIRAILEASTNKISKTWKSRQPEQRGDKEALWKAHAVFYAEVAEDLKTLLERDPAVKKGWEAKTLSITPSPSRAWFGIPRPPSQHRLIMAMLNRPSSRMKIQIYQNPPKREGGRVSYGVVLVNPPRVLGHSPGGEVQIRDSDSPSRVANNIMILVRDLIKAVEDVTTNKTSKTWKSRQPEQRGAIFYAEVAEDLKTLLQRDPTVRKGWEAKTLNITHSHLLLGQQPSTAYSRTMAMLNRPSSRMKIQIYQDPPKRKGGRFSYRVVLENPPRGLGRSPGGEVQIRASDGPSRVANNIMTLVRDLIKSVEDVT
jgi:hypothetical protein